MFEFISQSKEYAAEYDKKKEAMLKAKEDTQFHFSKKKSATVERKQVSQEKLEVRLLCLRQTTDRLGLEFGEPSHVLYPNLSFNQMLEKVGQQLRYRWSGCVVTVDSSFRS